MFVYSRDQIFVPEVNVACTKLFKILILFLISETSLRFVLMADLRCSSSARQFTMENSLSFVNLCTLFDHF